MYGIYDAIVIDMNNNSTLTHCGICNHTIHETSTHCRACGATRGMLIAGRIVYLSYEKLMQGRAVEMARRNRSMRAAVADLTNSGYRLS